MKHLLTAALACVCVCSVSYAASEGLTLTINPATKTFAFTGTDVGTLDESLAGYDATWDLVTDTPYEGSMNFFANFTPGTMISVTPSGGGIVESPSISFYLSNSSGGVAGFFLWVVANYAEGFSQITGLDEAYSYASYSIGAQSLLESIGGQTLLLTDGAGFSAVDIVVTPIPEPASSTLLAGGLTVVLLVNRRRRRAA